MRRRGQKGGATVHLTPKEFHLLHYLMKHAGLPMMHARILGAVWGPEYGNELEYLRTFIRQLRKKLEDDAAHPEVSFDGLAHWISVSGSLNRRLRCVVTRMSGQFRNRQIGSLNEIPGKVYAARNANTHRRCAEVLYEQAPEVPRTKTYARSGQRQY